MRSAKYTVVAHRGQRSGPSDDAADSAAPDDRALALVPSEVAGDGARGPLGAAGTPIVRGPRGTKLGWATVASLGAHSSPSSAPAVAGLSGDEAGARTGGNVDANDLSGDDRGDERGEGDHRSV